MPRSQNFTPGRGLFREHPELRVSGPFSFLNPTRARIDQFLSAVQQRDDGGAPQEAPAGADRQQQQQQQQQQQAAAGYEYRWRSRDNRKGRHALVVVQKGATLPQHLPQRTSSARQVLRGILRMFTRCPYWDISYLVATLFTLGSVVWVINGFFAYLPLVQPAREFPHELSTGIGVTAFLGATIFEVGSVFLLLEAVNEHREGCFGWAVERVWAGEVHASLSSSSSSSSSAGLRLMPDPEGCRHRHRHRKGDGFWKKFAGRIPRAAAEAPSSAESPPEEGLTGYEEKGGGTSLSWCWFPTWHDLRTHYLREIGFLASLVQFISATVFWISGFTALPNTVNRDNVGLVNGVFWTPQVIGGTGFIISGTLFMLETQSKWYIPAPAVLGWHVGIWNLTGGIGFTLCGALGFATTSSGAEYQSTLATFWGSWAFLIGSVIQWYESLTKFPVEVKRVKG
ncbi:hypothetical protein GP486_007865 [Trichoglossum hirsutum]|uniref:Integral membrane protein n=1 Tax=Trichoglossum hirsutum TaxID=265104 RepID=A0A9P8IAY2_9PEZI|nr:hypothetical protein GP486_007865 [Trichoglossum hirsutum]